MTDFDTNLLITAARPIHPANINLSHYFAFKTRLHDWIHSSKQRVDGLPGSGFLVSGVTDALNQTYALYNRIGIFDGEYPYTRKVIGDRASTDLSTCDAIVVSHPFSADGMSSHKKLEEADAVGVPIFVDCAFFGLCGDIDFDFTRYKNIHSVCFSLSKTFSTGLRRTGMLYTIDKYPASMYEDWSYPFIAGAEHHYDLLDLYSPDHMYSTYRQKQLEICDALRFVPSDTVIFGLDYGTKWQNFARGPINRMCISELLHRASVI